MGVAKQTKTLGMISKGSRHIANGRRVCEHGPNGTPKLNTLIDVGLLVVLPPNRSEIAR